MLGVAPVQRLQRVPVQLQFPCHVLDRRRSAAAVDIINEAACGSDEIADNGVYLLQARHAFGVLPEGFNLKRAEL